MAKEMDYNQGSLNQLIGGKGTVGLDFAIKLALVGQESLDTLCLRDPGQEFFRPGRPAIPADITLKAAVALHEPGARYVSAPKTSSRPKR
jgi:hypothetical protein